MNQITKEIILDYLQNNQIELQSTQTKLCLPIINRLCKKMDTGIKFPSIKVVDDLIIDGHHRYLASILVDVKLERVISSMTSATIVTKWLTVDFVAEDWYTQAKIQMLNEADAKYNDLSLEQIAELLK